MQVMMHGINGKRYRVKLNAYVSDEAGRQFLLIFAQKKHVF